ncbi:C-GCAxxG-C-C family (seleno)protein [Winogradskyella sp. A2]|uniref:C-GCAxxG-C-C family (seleno)protein n=1 Tax=Winogradskyella sp. A2 TaxID=3366944 RepID=UPI00398C4AC1
MELSTSKNIKAKETFKECGACSNTFANILNREFGYPNELAETALNPLAGGILNQGHQCGMLWGATLAVGAETYRKHKDKDKAIAVAVTATQYVLESFKNRSKAVNCKEILGYSISNLAGIFRLMINTYLKGMENSKCFNLAEEWAPEAIESAKKGLEQDHIKLTMAPVSCASEVVKKMGGTNEEALMVAGFAGGLGLSGNACGALSAAIWMKTLEWCRNNPKKLPPYFNNKIAKRILKSFNEITTSEISCKKITGEEFKNFSDHSEYIRKGGCEALIETLGKS